MKSFIDRTQAGRELAQRLHDYADRADTLVLALPRGGVPVAYTIAEQLHLPLDVLVVRKLGVPGQPELAMGAIASGDVVVTNEDVLRQVSPSHEAIQQVIDRERRELQRRERLYRGDLPALQIADCTVILVDDGAATGATMRAAVQALRHSGARKIVVALPTASTEAYRALCDEADEVVCVMVPQFFYAVGQWYREFNQTSDEEVLTLLQRARGNTAD